MAKVTLTTFLTVDGVMQGPGGPDEDTSDGFDLGGWVTPYVGDDMMRHVQGIFDRADAFLLGRTTYGLFAGHWPQVSDEEDPHVAKRLNTLPKYVASRTLDHLEWQRSTLLGGDVIDAVRKLKEQPGREIQVHGSRLLAQSLMAHDLIDEYNLFVFPVLLGKGKRLFADGTLPTGLRLTESSVTPESITVQTYVPTGRPTFAEYGA
ncbi:dihydrofolate reductase family protein [Streptomyces iconiensis]|uniref:Dihydrofolate reductase family protein n=1 Tax=Streptomyces iconiensis TaxID=1384038 RepID=A0ABT6ZWI6_9ACTN|nr:dihydrofolate reductase family protein [Streptomyces iconiensis]MDJ1133432.1 dihydrofolate reductase family protein [Streptomyces iconiensis]